MARIQFNDWEQTFRPRWRKDFGHRGTLLPVGGRLDPAAWPREDAVVVTADGNSVVDAETLTVEELSGPIPAGTILYFGPDKFALVTDDAAAGDTSIAVEALVTQIDDGDSATYEGTGRKYVPSGTIVGRTFEERTAGKGFGPVDYTAETSVDDDDVWIIVNDVHDVDDNPDVELYRKGSLVAENFLPGWDDLDPILKTWVRDNYECILGA